jgi:glucose dehydrogenase
MAESTRKTEVIERLQAGISQLTNSESWKRWLDVQSRFHHYSFFNTLLILSQRPDATRIAGFHTWRKLQRQILAGEHGLWILAPMTHRVAVDDDAAEESERVVRVFKAVPVFDVAQTKGSGPA